VNDTQGVEFFKEACGTGFRLNFGGNRSDALETAVQKIRFLQIFPRNIDADSL